MKKLLSVLIVGLFTSLGAFASATDYSFVATNDNMDYSPDEISFSSEFVMPDNASDFVKSYSCDTSYYANLTIHTVDYSIQGMIECDCEEGGTINFSSCTYQRATFPIGVYMVDRGSEGAFNSVTITDGVSNGGDDDSSALLPGISGSFGGGISNGVNAMLTGFGNVLPDILLYSLPIVIIFLFWRHIYVFIKAVFTGRSRSSIREEMFINDWYDNWSKSAKGKMIIAQEKVFQKELNTPGMQDKYFYTETIDKRGHLFNRYDQISDTREILGKDLKWHNS